MEKPGHELPQSTLVGTYIGLLVLAALMLAISQVPTENIAIDWLDLHAIKTTIVFVIALMMGSIIALYLMGLRYDHKLLNVTIFLSNFVFLLIFVLFTWADTSFRTQVDPGFGKSVNFISPVKSEEQEVTGEAKGSPTEMPTKTSSEGK